MVELYDLLIAVCVLAAMMTGGTIGIVEWRTKRLCKDIEDFKQYFEAGMQQLGKKIDDSVGNVHRRLDAHIERKGGD